MSLPVRACMARVHSSATICDSNAGGRSLFAAYDP